MMWKDTEVTTKLTHVLAGHTRDVLCADMEEDIVVSGGMDSNVLGKVFITVCWITFKCLHF